MTIADLIKYIAFLKERAETLKKKVRDFEITKTTQRVISTTAELKIVEDVEYVTSPKSMLSEYDETAKELRLAQQTLEKLNHTTETGFTPIY